MSQSLYNTARRVFWVMDNGSSHRGQASGRRLTQAHPTLVPVHGPIHASWLNQIEIYFSIVQRKVLTPNDFPCLVAVAERLANFERHFESIARPFEWKFTRADLNALGAEPALEAGRLRNTCVNLRNGLLRLMQNPGCATRLRQRFDPVLVDEVQDVNRLQADILYALKPNGCGLAAVGDDSQSIYAPCAPWGQVSHFS